MRFNYDDNYYDSKFQGIPEEGYSALIANILHHPRIEVQLNHRFTPAEATEFDHVFYTGPIDTYFGHRLGRLGYRTVQFERMEEAGDLQGCAQINYPSFKVPFTRVSEHKHFAPWEDHARTVAFKEFSKQTEAGDEPYYPIRRAEDKTLLESYYELARQESKVSFLGRLGTYRYLDMDEVIGEALLFSEAFLRALAEQTPTGLPRFSYVPPPRS